MQFIKCAAVALLLQSGIAWSEPIQEKLELSVFPGGFNWPIWVAQDKGNFARRDIAVAVNPTPNSVEQMTRLADGRSHIAMTAIDNVIAYREGQGEVPLSGDDLVAVMGGDHGFLSLVSVPEVNRIADLRGRQVSVDARNTGYAYVLFELLKRGGLSEPDFGVERVGGVLQRYQTLMDKKQAATLLISPFDLQAQAAGYHVLGMAAGSLGAYQGLVAAVRKSWAQEHRAQLIGYIEAYIESVEWLYDPANKGEALRIYRKHVPEAGTDMSEAAYVHLLDAQSGFQRKARIDLKGVTEVLRLRERWAEPARRLSGPESYYEGSYYDSAVNRFVP
nr:ABC transporter substrate-binding protein [uncultured Cupriavidus sp.]